MRCPECGGAIDSTFTCIRCGEVHDEPMQKIKKIMLSREDEAYKKHKD